MYTLDELKKQNEEISQLCDVLSILMEQPALHDNPFVCELMKRFKEKVWVHLVFEDNTIYAPLLHADDEEVSRIAKSFHRSAKEIKHRFSDFVRKSCSPSVSDEEHETLTKKSREVFSMIRERINYEDQKIFPLVEQQQSI